MSCFAQFAPQLKLVSNCSWQRKALDALPEAERAVGNTNETTESDSHQVVAVQQRWRAVMLRQLAEDCVAVGDHVSAAVHWRQVVSARRERERTEHLKMGLARRVDPIWQPYHLIV